MTSSLLRFGDPHRPGFSACSNCGVCLLTCPVWLETRDPLLTPAGRARALQAGAMPEEIAASAGACLLCGACEPVCPERIDTVGFLLGLRAYLAARGELPLAETARDLLSAEPRPWPDAGPAQGKARLLVPGQTLAADRRLLARVVDLLGGRDVVALPADDGHRALVALEAGLPADLDDLLDRARRADEVVVSDGLIARELRLRLPRRRVVGLGEALLAAPGVRGGLGPGDLYVIEPRSMNGDHERLVAFYDRLRQERGCLLSFDLHRTAMATGASSLQARLGAPLIDTRAAASWIAEGRHFRRVVVESADERATFAAATGVPVVHLAEVAA